jgi:alkanesulfonate monooxygenase SsuD/methylene tetrahydromethanopterin reductase-like flavin-dependent oxidoreductase (luciferase family)
MFIGYFTEMPYQDPNSGYFGATGRPIEDLSLSNAEYDPRLAAELYHRYYDEKLYAEEMGFDGLVLNEHHSTPFCMQGVTNTTAAILARITERAKIVLLGNVLPLWDDPLWLAEELAMIDTISRGRLVTGWVRGTGRESVTHNASPTYNWERYQEAHDFILKAWTEPGPFRWEGEHYDFRYVNPWSRPYQDPHPPIWIPGQVSKNTMEWAAKHRYPYIMNAVAEEPTKRAFEYYAEVAAREGYEAGPQHTGYLIKVHIDETEELAYETGKKYIEGPGNIFLEGSRGQARGHLQRLPGLVDRTQLLPTAQARGVAGARGFEEKSDKEAAASEVAAPLSSAEATPHGQRSYDELLETGSIVTGTPKTVIPKIRHILEYIRPGSIFFWDGDGAMTHDDAMRSLRLWGSDVLPAIREIADELELNSPFDVDPATNLPIEQDAVAL